MIKTLLLVGAYLGANDPFGAPVRPAQIGVAEPPAWWAAAVREETARTVAADLPETPRRFQFQCTVPELHKKPWRYVSPKCISADAGLVTDAATFARRAADEASKPVLTSEDRLRRAAWLRAMILYAHPAAEANSQRSFVIDEPIGADDLPMLPPPTALITRSDVLFEVPPHPQYSDAALQDNAQGTVLLSCRSEHGALSCRTREPKILAEVRYPDGGLLPDVSSYFLLLHDAQNSMQGVRVAPKTQDGRAIDGMDLSLSISFHTAG